MPKLKVGEVTIAYEVWGQGVPVVLTPQFAYPRNVFSYILAGRLAAHHKTFLWDRRNTGASDIKIEDVPAECQLWADVLHLILHELQMAPAYIGGASAGCFFSLYMAHRYPQDVKGLILMDPPTEDMTLLKPLGDARYFRLAAVAERQGMQAVITESTQAWVRQVSGLSKPEDLDEYYNWVAECIQMNPANRERLMSTEPHLFAAAMRQWGEWFGSPGVYRAHLSDDELARINVPALVLYGFNPRHPQETARELATLLPNAELVDYCDRYTEGELQKVQESDVYSSQNAFLKASFIETFLRQHEGVYQS
jgi:pimeloyl-ACP methyl ester carboxylesterase